MRSRMFFNVLTAACLCLAAATQGGMLEKAFQKPPPDARPWVYWFWLNGNITSNGITADLEAMRRVGIGGALIMEVDQGSPVGPVDFMSDRWRELFGHVHREASRLGLEINMNNDAGWNGSGGPWIKPEQAMQEVVWSETHVPGPVRFTGTLAPPPRVAGHYRDIAVFAFPSTSAERLPNITSKASAQRQDLHKPAPTEPGLPGFILKETLTNLTAKLDAGGRLAWDVPPGRWTIVRFGHTCTGVENAPAPTSGRGLECDKLSPEGMNAAFEGMMAKLVADNRIPTKGARGGLVATHIDSWENGSQNWTPRMREEFQKRRGYDLLPFLPVLTGRILGTADHSERFLWDLRQTVSELVIENYAGRMRDLAHAHGLRFTVEAYGSPCDAIPYAGRSDEPMGEFWTPSGALETCKAMASAAHVYGMRIVGAEACTSGDRERWLEHPALLKSHVDRAFCEGINRMVFHRYAMQPWPGDRAPGMTMGPWGQHYERTQTWWEWTPSWHTYLARSQHMLRQGRFVADICYVQPEAPPQGPGAHSRDGYDWDECTTEAVLNRMTVKDGRIVLPDGMSYQVLALPWSQSMTPALLRKVRSLVEEGATVLGPRPSSSPGLSGTPDSDTEVKQLATTLWGDADGQGVKEHRHGKGRVIVSDNPSAWLRDSGTRPDFASSTPLRHLHRRTDTADIYFVANLEPWAVNASCSFRVEGRIPELWWPETGRMETAAMWTASEGRTHVSIPLGPSGSVFVVFQRAAGNADPLVAIHRDGKPVITAAPEPPPRIHVTGARYGIPGDAQRSRDATAHVQSRVDRGEVRIPVGSLIADGDPAPTVVKTLVVDYEIGGRTFHVQARDPDVLHINPSALTGKVEKARYGVLDDPRRTRDMRGRVQGWIDAGLTSFKVADLAQGDDPAFLVVKTLELEITRDGRRETFTGQDPDTIQLTPMTSPSLPPVAIRLENGGKVLLEATEPGVYTWTRASGKVGTVTVPEAPSMVRVDGPWDVRFQAGRGAPDSVQMESLLPLGRHMDPGVKYFSGEATYTTTITVPNGAGSGSARTYLDLGRVEVMARVWLNGRDLGVLWKAPYRIDVTQALRSGANQLKVAVVTLWPNRLIGDEHLAEDSDRNPEGTLKTWPAWLDAGTPSPAGRIAFTSWRLWKKDDALRDSGLIGPIRLLRTPTQTMGSRLN